MKCYQSTSSLYYLLDEFPQFGRDSPRKKRSNLLISVVGQDTIFPGRIFAIEGRASPLYWSHNKSYALSLSILLKGLNFWSFLLTMWRVNHWW